MKDRLRGHLLNKHYNNREYVQKIKDHTEVQLLNKKVHPLNSLKNNALNLVFKKYCTDSKFKQHEIFQL